MTVYRVEEPLFGMLGRYVSSLGTEIIDVFSTSFFNSRRLIGDTNINVLEPCLGLAFSLTVVEGARRLTKRPIPLFAIIVPESGYPVTRTIL